MASIEAKQAQLIAANNDATVDGATKDEMTNYIRRQRESISEVNRTINDNARKITDPMEMTRKLLENVGRINEMYGDAGSNVVLPDMDPMLQTFFKLKPADQDMLRTAAKEMYYGLPNPLVNQKKPETGGEQPKTDEQPKPDDIADQIANDLLPGG